MTERLEAKTTLADAEFSRGGGFKFFAEHCMEMKGVGPRGWGGTSIPSAAPWISQCCNLLANDQSASSEVIGILHIFQYLSNGESLTTRRQRWQKQKVLTS